jgi:hypothetical protein
MQVNSQSHRYLINKYLIIFKNVYKPGSLTLCIYITRIGVDEEPIIQKQNICELEYSIYHEILIKIVLDEVFFG